MVKAFVLYELAPNKNHKNIISKSLYTTKMIPLNYSFCIHKKDLKRLEHLKRGGNY